MYLSNLPDQRKYWYTKFFSVELFNILKNTGNNLMFKEVWRNKSQHIEMMTTVLLNHIFKEYLKI